MRHLADDKRVSAVLLVLVGLVGLCAVDYTFHVGGIVDYLSVYVVYDAVIIAAGIVCAARAVSSRERLPWAFVGAAVVCWGVGDTIWTFAYQDRASPPFPSISDAFWLAVYPLLYAGLTMLVCARVRSVGRTLWIDGVLGGLAVAGLGTAVVFDAVLDATSGSKAAVATNVSYPLADLAVIALVIWALAVMNWRPGRAWGFLAVGLLVFSGSDCLYLYATAVGSYVAGGPMDLGWMIGSVLLACAAWQPEPKQVRRATGAWMLLAAPAAFALLALAILMYDHFHRVNTLSLGLTSAALVVVIGRMATVFAENLRMLAQSRGEARTDELTGLGNRRKFLDDLRHALDDGRTVTLALLDLNGFKHYNDTFGHPAGDAALARLGAALQRAVSGRGVAYRMGGDEFSVLSYDERAGNETIAAAAAALEESGPGFAISAACGAVELPRETATISEALHIADSRMYAYKRAGSARPDEAESVVSGGVVAPLRPRPRAHEAFDTRAAG
jgi:two-component system cell cycle response regulator